MEHFTPMTTLHTLSNNVSLSTVPPNGISQDQLVNSLKGISATTCEIITSGLCPVINSINDFMTTHPTAILTPYPEDIFNAFRYCPIEQTNVVIIALDPYPGVGEAQGLAFSTRKSLKLTRSLENISLALIHSGFCKDGMLHGDLTSWAHQGVLLLNCALTTIIGKTGAHKAIWFEYINTIIKQILTIRPHAIFMLWGTDAQDKTKYIPSPQYMTWGHPSPLNRANNNKNPPPTHFMFNPAFKNVNASLIARGELPICWNNSCIHNDNNDCPIRGLGNVTIIPLVKEYVVTQLQPSDDLVNLTNSGSIIPINPITTLDLMDENDTTPNTEHTLWVFTDGGARANGTANCIASYGYYITDGIYKVLSYGQVAPVQIIGKKYQASNNRGELLAIKLALECILMRNEQVSQDEMSLLKFKYINIVSDSEYSIKSAIVWDCDKYKLNSDLITPIKHLLNEIDKTYETKFLHVRSHRSECNIPDKESDLWFMWRGNTIADELCEKALINVAADKATKKPSKKSTTQKGPFIVTHIEKYTKLAVKGKVTNTQIIQTTKPPTQHIGFDY